MYGQVIGSDHWVFLLFSEKYGMTLTLQDCVVIYQSGQVKFNRRMVKSPRR
jgi:hypothetical protein